MIFNEIIVVICGYLALIISYIDNDPDFNNYIGWAVNFVILVFSVVNFGVIAKDGFVTLKH